MKGMVIKGMREKLRVESRTVTGRTSLPSRQQLQLVQLAQIN